MRKSFLIVAASVSLASCVYVAPPFTSVSQIAQVRPKMKLKQVVDVLGIEPYDIYNVQQTGGMIAAFNYRVKNRRMRVTTLNSDEFNRQTTDENSQTAGELCFDKDYKTVHVLFDGSGDMASFITTDGLEKSNLIMITGNTISYADEKKINLLDPNLNGQVIELKKKEKKLRQERRSIFSRLFGIFYRNK